MLLHFSNTLTGEAHFCAPAFSYVLKSKKRPLLCPDVEFTRACAQPSYRETTSYTSLQSLLGKPPTNSVKNVVKTTQQNGNHRSQLSFFTQHTKTHELSDMPMLLSFFHIFVDMAASLRSHKRKMSLLVTSVPKKNDFCQTRLLQTVSLNCLGKKLVSRGRKTDMKTCAAKRIPSHCSMTLFVIDLIQKKWNSSQTMLSQLYFLDAKTRPKRMHSISLHCQCFRKIQKFQVNASHPHCWSRKHLKMAWDTEAGQNRPIMSGQSCPERPRQAITSKLTTQVQNNNQCEGFFFPPVWPMSLSGSVLTWEEASAKENSAPNTVVSAEWQFHTLKTSQTPAQTTRKNNQCQGWQERSFPSSNVAE